MFTLSIYKNKHFAAALFSVLLVAPGVSSSFQLSTNKNIRVHGFASQSLIYTDNNNFFGNSANNGSLDYTELGVNISYQVQKKLHTAVQLLSRRAGEFDNGRVKLDFAIADFRLQQTSKYSVGIRAGRVKNPFGFYNDTRDVSFTRPSILLPQSIYFERTRDVSISSDGLQLYGHRDFKLGSTQLQLVAAMPRVGGENTEIAVLSVNRPGNFTGKPSYLSRISFQTHDKKFKLSLSDAILNTDYEEAGVSNDTSLQFRLSIVSFQYRYANWSLTTEYARRKIRFKNMTTNYLPSFLANTTGESYYFQVAYHASFHWKIFARYDVLFQDKNDKDGTEYANNWLLLGNIKKPAYARFAKDITIGVQWDLNSSWMLRTELHIINGTAWLPLQDNTDIDNAAQKWRMATASVSYRF